MEEYAPLVEPVLQPVREENIAEGIVDQEEVIPEADIIPIVNMAHTCPTEGYTVNINFGSDEQKFQFIRDHMQVSHQLTPPGAPTGGQFARDEPATAPKITGEMTPAKWRSFNTFWGEFKLSVGLMQANTPKDKVANRLKRCLDDRIREKLQVRCPT